MQKDSTVDTEFQNPDGLDEFDDVNLDSSMSQIETNVQEENVASSSKTESNKSNKFFQLFQQIKRSTPLPKSQANPNENNLEDKTDSGIKENCTCKQYCCIL